MNKFLIFFALLIVLILGGFYFLYPEPVPVVQAPIVLPTDTAPTLLDRVVYMCGRAMTIDASYYEGVATTTVIIGQPPVPTGNVQLLLSDGRTFDVPQTISASGVRYANTDETFIFWNKGNSALILENGAEKEYMGCVRIASPIVGVNLPATYVSSDATFSIRLPSLMSTQTPGYSVDETFKNQVSPDKSIAGIKFTIPKMNATGTNLSSDTYISVEHIPVTQVCDAGLFFNETTTVQQKIENGTSYSVATSTGAGAGNRYDEIVYALPGTNPCTGVRYMIHSMAIENYATGTITAFNRTALMTEFDHIRQSLVVNQ